MLVSCAIICVWYIRSWMHAAFACLIGSLIHICLIHNTDIDHCNFRYPHHLYIVNKSAVIIVFVWSYCSLGLISYISEYSDRLSFYRNMKLNQKKEQLKDWLNHIPLSIVTLRNGELDFVNAECFNMFGRAVTVESFDKIKGVRDSHNLKYYIENPLLLPEAEKLKYTYEDSANKKYYLSLKHSQVTFKGEKATIIILQDQTLFEQLKELEEKYQRLYFASVVHDIRTPLNGILGMLDLIEQSSIENDVVKKYTCVARNSAKQLLFLTYDVTDYSQIEANNITINKALFSPMEVVEECTQMLEFNFQRRNVALEKNISDSVPFQVVSDRNRYTQILLNLLGNALKFTTQGSVKITLSYLPSEDLLVTNVKDTGIGIRDDDMPKLFKIFGRVKEGMNSVLNPNGVGLGLAICKRLTECMGGSIKVESSFGWGSSFVFTIKANLDYCSSIAFDIPEEKITEVERTIGSHSLYPFKTPKRILKRSTSIAHREGVTDDARLLIVDDNDQNLFVLQSYSGLLGLKCDVVQVRHLTKFIGL